MKTLLNFVVAICALSSFGGCSASGSNNKHQGPRATINFRLEKTIEIDLPFEYEAGFNLTSQAYSRNDTDFVLLGDMMEARLIEIDLNHGKFVRSIPLPRIARGRYPVFTFHYVNEDTIVILPDISNEHGLYHDSLLFSINIQGIENGNFNLNDSPFIMSWMDRDSSKATFFHHFSPMKMQGNTLFVNPLPLKSGMTQGDIEKHDVPELGYFNLNGMKDLYFQLIQYHPNERVDTQFYAHEQERLNICLRDPNTIMVSHANLPELHLVNKNTGQFSSSNETGRFIPDPTPLKNSVVQPSYNPNSTVFRNLIFDSQTDFSYRFATYPSDENLKPGDLSAFRADFVWVGAYDDELKLIAQALKPSWFKLHPEPIFVNGKCITIEQDGDRSKFKIQITSLDTVNLAQSEYLLLKDSLTSMTPVVSEEDVHLLFRELSIPSNCVVLTISARSCPYCLDYATEYFLANLNRMERQNVFLVASDESASPQLRTVESPNILIVDNGRLEDILELNITNPALMIWDGNKVTNTTVLPPDQVTQIDQLLSEFQSSLRE